MLYTFLRPAQSVFCLCFAIIEFNGFKILVIVHDVHLYHFIEDLKLHVLIFSPCLPTGFSQFFKDFNEFPVGLMLPAGQLDQVDLCTPEKTLKNIGGRGRIIQRPTTMSQSRNALKEKVEEALQESQQAPNQKSTGLGDKPKKRRRKAPKDAGNAEASQADVVEAEGPEEKEAQKSAAEASRKRTRKCKSRVRSLKEQKRDIVKSYLAQLNITWQKSQHMHSNRPIQEKDAACKKDRGFVEMQEALAEGQMPECLTCCALLKNQKFVMKDLEAELQSIEDGGANSPVTKLQHRLATLDLPGFPLPETCLAVEDQKEEPGMLPICNGEEPPSQDSQSKPAGSQETPVSKSLPTNPWKLFQSMKCLEFLGPRQQGKQFGARCHACKSANQREGKVFELHSLRRKDIEFFTKQFLV